MPKLNIKDKFYGKWEITEPVLIDAYNSQAIERLKKINQLGPPEEYYFCKGFSRFEHSVGVMLLLRRLGADLKEQLAGLLHDSTHAAFSHVYDYFDLTTVEAENFHDRNAVDILSKSDLPEILAKHDFNLEELMNHKNFPLLKSPDKHSADRIDYTFRELDPAQVAEILPALQANDHQIFFTDVARARQMALATLKLQINNWGSSEGTNRFYHFAQILQLAIKEGIIKPEDSFKDDEYIMQELLASNNQTILSMLNRLKTADFTNLPPTNLVLPRKFRYLDPNILINNQIIKLSSIDEDFHNQLNTAKQKNKEGITILKLF